MQKNRLKKYKGVTIIELLTVVIIIGILAAVAIPIFTKKIERTKGERAIANIELIVTAYKQYYIKNGSPAIPVDNGLDFINTRFGLDLVDDDFSYEMASESITATRNGQTIIYNIDPADYNVDDWGAGTWPWHP